jgi:rfaE bifunctional protein kinase chain/domain/rfaE bifunctional protein nucleotidyltransferase chain/domain
MISKFLNNENLNKIIFSLKKKNIYIGLCHGVFDLLHLGHINHFKEAKENCDVLIVSVTADKFVHKGPGRPAFNQQQRVESLSALECIDYVTISNNPSSVEIINKIKPNIYFKGPDYKNIKLDITKKILLENNAIRKNKGKVFITRSFKYSSSALLNSFTQTLSEQEKILANKIKKNYSFERIKKIIQGFSDITPLVIGELIIDQYFFCEALGKSGKEPILVLRDKYNETYLGGAAAICGHLSEFCSKINFLSMVGEKKEYINFVKKHLNKKIKYYLLKKKNSPTIVKKRFLDEISKSKLLGVYSLEDSFVNRIEEKNLIKEFNKFNKKSDLTILSDYSHGMISKNFCEIIKKKSKFLAVNIQINAANIGYHSLKNYRLVDFMIINESEIRHEMRSKNDNIYNLAKNLANNFKIKYLVVTQGSQGAFLYERKKNIFYKIGAFTQSVVDKVGAGDTMLSILAICLYKKIDINLSLLISSLAAAQSVKIMGNKFHINKNILLKEIEHFLL